MMRKSNMMASDNINMNQIQQQQQNDGGMNTGYNNTTFNNERVSLSNQQINELNDINEMVDNYDDMYNNIDDHQSDYRNAGINSPSIHPGNLHHTPMTQQRERQSGGMLNQNFVDVNGNFYAGNQFPFSDNQIIDGNGNEHMYQSHQMNSNNNPNNNNNYYYHHQHRVSDIHGPTAVIFFE